MRASVHGPGRPSWPPMIRFSSTVRDGNRRRPSGTRAMPRATRVCAGTSPIASPSNTMASRRERMSPAIDCRSVLFPAPLAPITATTSPRATAMVTPNSAWKSPYQASSALMWRRFVMREPLHWSSPSKREPMTTCGAVSRLPWLWVPACAGTTERQLHDSQRIVLGHAPVEGGRAAPVSKDDGSLSRASRISGNAHVDLPHLGAADDGMRIALRDERAAVQHHQPVHRRDQRVHDVLDPHDGDAAAAHIANQCDERGAFVLGEPPRHLVEQQHAGARGQRTGEFE